MAIYKHGQGFELGIVVNKSITRGSGPAPNYNFGALTARPRCLPNEGKKDMRYYKNYKCSKLYVLNLLLPVENK